MAEREQARAAYLDRASRLADRITLFNAVRLQGLWWLEWQVPTLEKHASDFDAACPPVADEDNPVSRHDLRKGSLRGLVEPWVSTQG